MAVNNQKQRKAETLKQRLERLKADQSDGAFDNFAYRSRTTYCCKLCNKVFEVTTELKKRDLERHIGSISHRNTESISSLQAEMANIKALLEQVFKTKQPRIKLQPGESMQDYLKEVQENAESSSPKSEKQKPKEAKPAKDWRAKLQKSSRSDATKKAYTSIITRFEDWLQEEKIKEVDKNVLEDYIHYFKEDFKKQNKEVADSTIQNQIAAIRYKLVDVEGLKKEIIPKVVIKNQVRPHIAYSDDELQSIFDFIKKDREFYLMTKLLYDLAGRAQDIAKLKWDDIRRKPNGTKFDFAKVFLKGQKSKARTCVLAKDTYELLMEHQKRVAGREKFQEYVLGGITDNAVSQRFSRNFSDFRLDVQSHNFRKTRLTNLYKKTKNIVFVRDYAGHRDTKTTEIYIDLKDLNMDAAFQDSEEEEEEVRPRGKRQKT